MDIRSFRDRETSLIPDQSAVVEEGVCNGGRDGCKRKPVENYERCGKEDGAVSLVSLEVE